jgi:hypothetical protein
MAVVATSESFLSVAFFFLQGYSNNSATSIKPIFFAN